MYIVPDAIFLPGLRILISKRAQWNGEVLHGQRSIPIFTDGPKLGGGTVLGFTVGNSVLNFTSG